MYQVTLTPAVDSPPPEAEVETEDKPVAVDDTPQPTSTSTSTSTAPAPGKRGQFSRAQTIVGTFVSAAEATRLHQDADREANWKRWGPYLSERQWATVREDYSASGSWYSLHASVQHSLRLSSSSSQTETEYPYPT